MRCGSIRSAGCQDCPTCRCRAATAGRVHAAQDDRELGRNDGQTEQYVTRKASPVEPDEIGQSDSFAPGEPPHEREASDINQCRIHRRSQQLRRARPAGRRACCELAERARADGPRRSAAARSGVERSASKDFATRPCGARGRSRRGWIAPKPNGYLNALGPPDASHRGRRLHLLRLPRHSL